jgi:hypothetical protein
MCGSYYEIGDYKMRNEKGEYTINARSAYTTTHTSDQTSRAKTNKYIIGATIHVAKPFTT